MRFVYRRRRERAPVSKRGKPKDIKIGILFPIPYRAAMSSLFLHYAYIALNQLEGVVAYRYVYDLASDTLESLDTSEPPTKLDAILVSTPFELDYVALARIAIELGLAPRKGYSKPILISGGIAPTANPLPLASIVDAVVIGEAEPILGELAYAVGEESRQALEALAEIRSIYTPSMGTERVERCIVGDLDRAPHPAVQIVPLEEEPVYGHGLRVEVSRGCRRFCAFCLEGHVTIPLRWRSLEILKRIVEAGIEYQLHRRVVIYSLSLFDVPHADQFLEFLADYGIEASVPSLRPDYLNRDRIELIRKLGQRTLTVAPETMVKDLGCSIGKCIDRDTMVEIVLHSYRAGFTHLKVYLIAGFPCEDVEKSLEEIQKFLEDVRKCGVSRAKYVRFSLNPLIPKPWTPFQRLPPSYVLDLEGVLRRAERVLETPISEIEVMDPEWGFAQAVLSLGSKETSKLILDWAMHGLSLRGFKQALEAHRHELTYIEKGWDTPPWVDIVKPPVPLTYLENRFAFLSRLRCSRR